MGKKAKGLMEWLRDPNKAAGGSITEDQVNSVLEKAFAAPANEDVKAVVTAPVVLMRKDRKTFKVVRVWCQAERDGKLNFAKCIETDWRDESDPRREMIELKICTDVEVPPGVKAKAVYLEI